MTSRNTTARPDISSGRSGRTNLTTSATIAGKRKAPRDPHRGVARERGGLIELQWKRPRRRIVKQRSKFQIEFGINPKQQFDHKRERQRDEKSGPVHGAGFSRGDLG